MDRSLPGPSVHGIFQARVLEWGAIAFKPRQHIKKQRHCFAYSGPHSQSYGFFPLVMYRCESWTVKKAEHWRTDAFKLWCWRRLCRVPWTTRRPNQSILKEINPEYALEELMLTLKLQHFGHMMWRANSLEKTLMLGKIKGRRIQERQRMRWGWMASPSLACPIPVDMSLSELWEMVKDREPGMLHGVARSWTQLRDWTTAIGSCVSIITFNVNRLNSPTKRHRLAGHMKTYACMHFYLPHHPAWPPILCVIILYC